MRMILTSILAVFSTFLYSQNLQVETILDLNASDGVTFGSDGNVYVNDFGIRGLCFDLKKWSL